MLLDLDLFFALLGSEEKDLGHFGLSFLVCGVLGQGNFLIEKLLAFDFGLISRHHSFVLINKTSQLLQRPVVYLIAALLLIAQELEEHSRIVVFVHDFFHD